MGDLPIGYYTFVRIIITIGAVCIIVNEPVKDLNFWRVAFGLIAIVFNPIIPVYLHDKAIWMPIDIIAAILFTIKLSILKSTKHEGLLYSATAAVFVGSGFLAWEWTEPNSFWSAVGFLIVWGILTKIGHFIVSLIVMGIASIFD